MRTSRISTFAALCVIVVIGQSEAPNVWAAPCSTAAKTRAQRFVLQGKRLLSAQKAQQAVAALKQALRHCPAREIHFNLAVTYTVLKDYLRAARHLRRFLVGANLKERQSLPPMLQGLLKKVGVIRLQTDLTQTKVTFWVDGRHYRRWHSGVEVLPGRHLVELRCGQQVMVQNALPIRGGQDVVWGPELPKCRGPLRRRLHWAYFTTAAVLTVASGAGLTYTGVRTLALREDEKSARDLGQTAQAEALAQEFKRYRLVTNLLVGVTAAIGTTAVVLALFTHWRRAKERPHVSHPRISVTPAILQGGGFLLLGVQY